MATFINWLNKFFCYISPRLLGNLVKEMCYCTCSLHNLVMYV